MTQDKNQQQIKLYIDDRGDMSVGIFPTYDEVTISFEYGCPDEEFNKNTIEAIRDTLRECYDTKRVFTEEEWKKEIGDLLKDY